MSEGNVYSRIPYKESGEFLSASLSILLSDVIALLPIVLTKYTIQTEHKLEVFLTSIWIRRETTFVE